MKKMIDSEALKEWIINNEYKITKYDLLQKIKELEEKK